MHYSALFLCTFPIFYFSNLYFLMLHFFYVVLFSCCTFFILHHFHVALFLCSNLFMLHFFSCYTLFMYCTISCCTFTRCSVFVLYSSPVALFKRCSQHLHKHLKWRVLQQQLTKPLNIVTKLSILDVCGGPGCASTISMLHIFHVAHF